MPQVVRTAHQRRGELARSQRLGTDLLPDPPPGGRLDGIASLAPEHEPVRAGAEAREVLTQQRDQLRRDGDLADSAPGLLAIACSSAGAALEAAMLVDPAVVGVGLPGRG